MPIDPVPTSNFLLYFGVVMGCLFAISEAIGAIPSVKANGVFQAIFNIIKALAGKDTPKLQ